MIVEMQYTLIIPLSSGLSYILVIGEGRNISGGQFTYKHYEFLKFGLYKILWQQVIVVN